MSTTTGTIALLVDEYIPESRRIHATMMHHLALELQSRGHHVLVITPTAARINRPGEFEEIEGVRVFRVRSKPLRGGGNVKRAIAESLLPFQTLRALLKGLVDEKVTLCVTYSPTIFWGPVALWFRMRGAKTYLILRDFFPQWLIDEKIIDRWSPAAIHFRIFEKINYAASDYIAVQSPGNVKQFYELTSHRPKKIGVLFNWIRDSQPSKSDFGKKFLRERQLHDSVVLFYGGAVGASQNIDILLDLASRIRDLPKVVLLIVGEGGEFNRIRCRVESEGIDNVIISAAVNEEDYQSLLREVDVGLVALKSSHRSHNIPGKIMGYLQNGLPILGIVNIGNDLVDIIQQNKVGLLAEGDDIQELENKARKIVESISGGALEGLSIRAKGMAKNLFSVEAAADKILSEAA